MSTTRTRITTSVAALALTTLAAQAASGATPAPTATPQGDTASASEYGEGWITASVLPRGASWPRLYKIGNDGKRIKVGTLRPGEQIADVDRSGNTVVTVASGETSATVRVRHLDTGRTSSFTVKDWATVEVLGVSGTRLLVSTESGTTVRRLDGSVVRRLTRSGPSNADGEVAAVSGRSIVRVDTATGKTTGRFRMPQGGYSSCTPLSWDLYGPLDPRITAVCSGKKWSQVFSLSMMEAPVQVTKGAGYGHGHRRTTGSFALAGTECDGDHPRRLRSNGTTAPIDLGYPRGALQAIGTDVDGNLVALAGPTSGCERKDRLVVHDRQTGKTRSVFTTARVQSAHVNEWPR